MWSCCVNFYRTSWSSRIKWACSSMHVMCRHVLIRRIFAGSLWAPNRIQTGNTRLRNILLCLHVTMRAFCSVPVFLRKQIYPQHSFLRNDEQNQAWVGDNEKSRKVNSAICVAECCKEFTTPWKEKAQLLCISFRFASCYIICESFAICPLPGASFCSLLSNTHFVSAGFLAAADGCFQHPIERRRNMAGKGMQPTGSQSMFLASFGSWFFSRLAYLDYNLFFQNSNLARINLAAFRFI